MSIRNTYTLSSLSVAAVPRSSRRSGSVGGLGRTSSDSSSALSALSGFLTREEFERFFELLTIEVDGKEQTVIHALYEGLYSDGWISARGVGSSSGGSGGGGTAVNLLTSWSDYTTAMATTHALSAGLGYDLYTRVGALENGGSLSAFNLVQSGSGNAVTALSLSSDKKTLTITKGSTFLTSSEAASIYQPKGNYLTEHQSLADYLTKAEAATAYQPKGSYITAITKSMVEGVLTGNITTHTHSQYLTQHQDISHLLSKTDAASLYVKKVGDTMTGPLQLNSTLKIGATGIVVSYDVQNNAICFDGNIYAKGWISARGVGSSSGGSGGGGTAVNLLTSWSDYTTAMATTHALSAGLGYGLRSDLTALTGRVSTLEGKNYLDAFNLAQSGSGNAVTALSLSSDKKTLTVTKGANYTPWATRTAAYVGSTNLANEIFNIENEALVVNYYSYWHGINLGGYSGGHYGSQIVMPYQNTLSDTEMFIRTANNNNWRTWRRVLHDGNASSILGNSFVTLSTAQTISGAKTFSESLSLAQTTGNGVGISLYGGATHVLSYGLLFAVTSNYGKHGAVQGDWATYFTMDGATNRGWVFRHKTAGNVASVSAEGKITASSFIKSGGTASQFLMADGSVKALTDITSAYVTSLGTSGNYLTWTKNGATNNITVPFATAASKLNSRGNLTALTEKNMGEAGVNLYQVYNNGYPTPYGNLLHVRGIGAGELLMGWAGADSGYASLYYRNHRDNETTANWSPWVTILDSSNFNSLIGSNLTAYVKKAGDTMTGALLMTTAATAPAASTPFAISNGRIQSYGNIYLNANSDNGEQDEYILLTAKKGLSSSKADGLVVGPSSLTWQNNTLWHAGNDGSGSGLDADLLDGLHASRFSTIYNHYTHNRYMCLGTLTIPQNGYEARLWLLTGKGYNAAESQARTAMIIIRTSNGHPQQGKYYAGHVEAFRFGSYTIYVVQNSSTNFTLWTSLTEYTGSGYIAVDYSSGCSFTASTSMSESLPSDAVALPTYQHAYTDSNVASATKLQTARTIWGQSFDGSGNVSGNMTGVGSITFANASAVNVDIYGNLKFKSATETHTWTVMANSGAIGLCVKNNGNVGIGTTSPAYKLDVNGTLRASSIVLGSVTLSYDSANGALKINGAAYTTGWLSGQGVGSSAGGTGGSVNFLTAWSSYTASMANTYALSAGLGYDLHTRLQNVYTKGTCDGKYGSTLAISGSTLTLKSPDGTSLKSVTLPTSSGSGTVSLSITNSGSGNAVTGITASGTTLTVTKGSTFSLSNHTHTAYATTMDLTANVLRIRNGNTQLASVTLPYATSAGLEQVSTLAITLYTECGSDLALSGSTLQLKNNDGTVVSSVTLPSGGSSSDKVSNLYSGSKLCAAALSTGGLAVYGSITNGSTSTTSNIGNSITSFNAGYFQSVYVKGTAVTSDARLKTIIGDVSLTVEQIAHAPAVNFIWKENGLRSAGSIAQYWRTYLPDTVNVDDMGDKLYLDYSRAALLSAIITARRVLTVESRMLTAEEKIELLTAEVTELKEKLNRYENNNITPNDNEKDN